MSQALLLKSNQFIHTADILINQCKSAKTTNQYLCNAAMHSIYYSTFLRVKYILDKVFDGSDWLEFKIKSNIQVFDRENASHKEVIERLANLFSFIKERENTLSNFSAYISKIRPQGTKYLMSTIVSNIGVLKDNRQKADYKEIILLKEQIEKQYTRAVDVLKGLDYIDSYLLNN